MDAFVVSRFLLQRLRQVEMGISAERVKRAMVTLKIADDVPGLALAIVELHGVKVGPSCEELREQCDEAVRVVVENGWPNMEVRKKEIRQLLRTGGYKPSGRNKPAQEYLLRSATIHNGLPVINNAVDLLNCISLQSGIPISLVALNRIGSNIIFRFGKTGESYVFNAGGQELDVKGLLCLCRNSDGESVPVGSPVKDSMTAKLLETDHHIMACFYASQSAISYDELHRWALLLGNGALQFCGADSFEVTSIPDSGW